MVESGEGAESVRGKLVEAASRLLVERPPDQVTTKDIARLAGVNHGQIHHYFGSKHGLYWRTIQAGPLRLKLDGSRSVEGWDDSVLPAPLDPEIAPGWRVLAYLMINDQWKPHQGMEFPKVLELVLGRAAENGHKTPTTECVAETVAALSIQGGWWLYYETIIGSLQHFSSDLSDLPLAVARRSHRLLDPSIPTSAVGSRHEVGITTSAKDSDQLSDGAEEQSTDVSSRLVRAAFELLADSPPSSVTSKAIAARAGVNHGQIHHYFGSKDRLIAATVDFDSNQFVEARRSLHQTAIVPIQTLGRPALWRTFAYLAMTGDDESQVPTPNLQAMVESTAERLGRPVSDDAVHAEVAAVYSMSHGWTTFQDLLESAYEPFIDDIEKFRVRLAELSTRLVDQPG